MFNLCWTETHTHTIVGRSYADSDFHDGIKAIFCHSVQNSQIRCMCYTDCDIACVRKTCNK